ncbi:TPA: hypothetical protein L9M98_004691 [Klebsiella pneumoniae]|nr:hypothetical protein [Klebsiella pneumoniae]
MSEDIDVRIVYFLEEQKKHSGKTFFSTREIADAAGLTIYQARAHLESLHSSFVVEKLNNTRQGVPGQWRLL